MSLGIKEVKGEFSNLSEAELEKFAVWFARLREQRFNRKRCDTIPGIPFGVGYE